MIQPRVDGIRPAEAGSENLMSFESLTLEPETVTRRPGRTN
jgi:hypothetical protein